MVLRKMKGGKHSDQRSWSLLLFGMEVRVLVAAARGCVCGAEISTGPWMVHSNVIEKIKNISCQHGIYKYKSRKNILTSTRGRFFSLVWRRGCWRRRPVVLSVGQVINWPMDGAQ